MFVLGLSMELGAIPSDIGPYATMGLMFLFSQVAFMVLTPRQWKSMLGLNGKN
jgi:hypothetical protein